MDLMNTDHDAASDKQTTIHQVHNHCVTQRIFVSAFDFGLIHSARQRHAALSDAAQHLV